MRHSAFVFLCVVSSGVLATVARAQVDTANRALFIPADLEASKVRALMETIPLHAEASRDRLYIDPSPEGLAHAEKLGAAYDPVARRYFVPPSLDQAAAQELVHSYGTAEARLASSSRVETLAAQRAELGHAA